MESNIIMSISRLVRWVVLSVMLMTSAVHADIFGPPSGTTPTTGVTDASSAAAGKVGEVISSTVAFASATSLTTVTNVNVTSITLTAGDWDVEGACGFNPAVTTTVAYIQCGISTVSATVPAVGSGGRFSNSYNNATVGATITSLDFGLSRVVINVSSTTTVYLVAVSSFATSTNKAYGGLIARRVR